MNVFSINTNWQAAETESKVVSATAGFMKMECDGKIITKNYASSSQKVYDTAFLSAYPLAEWIASSWWRLFYEPEPISAKQGFQNPEWQMAHYMPAVGYGFVWPLVLFASDGRITSIRAERHESVSHEPLQYIQTMDTKCASSDIKESMNIFLDATIERLHSEGIQNTDLHDIVALLRQEQANPILKEQRILEACLGYDPESLDADFLNYLYEFQKVTGKDVCRSLLNQWAYEDMNIIKMNVEQAKHVATMGLQAKLQLPQLSPLSVQQGTLVPWEAGRQKARLLRDALGIQSTKNIDQKMLLDFFSFTQKDFTNIATDNIKYSLATHLNNSTNIVLRKTHSEDQGRFILSRMLSNSLEPMLHEPWNIVTDGHSYEQREQRAFAAEFLAPVEGIVEYTNRNFTSSDIENAANHYGVSSYCIETQLVSHQLMPPHHTISLAPAI